MSILDEIVELLFHGLGTRDLLISVGKDHFVPVDLVSVIKEKDER